MLPRGFLLAALALGMPVGAAPAGAQGSDPAAQRLIDQLRPGSGGSRGIRMPAPDDGRPAPTAGTPSAGAPAAQPATPPSAAPQAATGAPRPARPAATTATPSGMASITVNFPTGSATLTPAAAQTLAPLGRALSSADLRAFRFRIEGHTDTVGDAEGNQALSERRAEAVRAYLIQNFRVPPARLEALGLGEGSLAVPTADNVAEPRNRRVLVVNIGE